MITILTIANYLVIFVGAGWITHKVLDKRDDFQNRVRARVKGRSIWREAQAYFGTWKYIAALIVFIYGSAILVHVLQGGGPIFVVGE